MSFIKKVAEQFNQINDEQFELASKLISEVEGIVYTVGAGGSSATMSHFTSDLLNQGIHSVCVTDNVPRLTATVNDHGWDKVYRTMLVDFVKPDDLIVIASVNGSSGKSGSGEAWSSNLFDLAQLFKEKGGKILSIVGNEGGNLKSISDQCICISSKDPFLVEGVHSMVTHGICNMLRWRKKID